MQTGRVWVSIEGHPNMGMRGTGGMIKVKRENLRPFAPEDATALGEDASTGYHYDPADGGLISYS